MRTIQPECRYGGTDVTRFGDICGDCSGCRCAECANIHSEFIEVVGRWPSMTHDEGQELKERRLSNRRSWQRVTDHSYSEPQGGN